MPRQDLLAICEEDLERYSNRGALKRAARELEAGGTTFALQEAEDGTVILDWSDGVTCTLPGAGTVADGRCTCPATVGMCRHLVRSVLAYQKARRGCQVDAGAQSASWDPGQITDAMLEARFPQASIAAAKVQFDQGLLIEVVRGPRPVAHFHGLGHTTRFMVPGDLRYARCDTTGPEAAQAVIMAVWAFRLLAPELEGGHVVSSRQRVEVNRELAADIEQEMVNLLGHGFSGAPPHFADTLQHHVERCRGECWIWPAENLSAVAEEYNRYHAHDALCNPEHALAQLAEWTIRMDALRAENCPVPALLVRGMKSDRPRQLGTSRLVGLGCAVRRRKKGATLQLFLQDADTAAVVLLEREFAMDAAREYWQLAETPLMKGVLLRTLAAGQILMSGARRTASGQLVPSRRATVNPQSYAWEQLREPVRVDLFAELQKRQGNLPPAALRPVRAAGDFHVLRVARIAQAGFDVPNQTVRAELLDADANSVHLAYPHVSEAREGTEALLDALTRRAAAIRFVAGLVRPASRGLEILPVSLVVEENGNRQMLQPWIDRFQPVAATAAAPIPPTSAMQAEDPLRRCLDQMREAGAELLLVGLRRSDQGLARHWKGLAAQAEGLGLAFFAERAARVANELERQAHDLRWDWRPAAQHLLNLAVCLHIAREQA